MSAVSKGKGLKFDLPPVGAVPAAPAAPPEPVTGVMRHAGLAQELHSLRAQVERLEGERGAQPLDPKLIRPSRWANRHADSLTGPEFDAFKAEIADAGGNVQPIKVRPVSDGLMPDGARYEIVFGHRRHRACLDLGLPVLAVVQETDERGLWVEMERENRARANLSAWEQGMMYRRALDAGLFPSQAMLAKAIGRAAQDVSEAVRIANLPDEVVSAFQSPNDIQFRWAKPLADAVKADMEGVVKRAKAAASDGLMRATPAKVFMALVQREASPPAIRPSDAAAPASHQMVIRAGKHAEIRSDGKRVTLELDAELLPPDTWAALEKALRRIAKGKRD